MLDLASGQRAFTVALNLAMAVSVGANLALAWAAGNRSAWTAGYLRRLRFAAILAVFTAIAVSVPLLWMEAAAMAEVDVLNVLATGQSVAMLVTATQYGHAWLFGMFFLFLAAGAALLPLQRRSLPAISGILCALVFFYTRSISSHAAGDGALTWAALADWVHLSLISVWVGEVVIAGFLVLPRHPGTESGNRLSCRAYLLALSSSASVAVAGIALTGIVNAMHNLTSVGELGGNPYGNALLLETGAGARCGVAGRRQPLLCHAFAAGPVAWFQHGLARAAAVCADTEDREPGAGIGTDRGRGAQRYLAADDVLARRRYSSCEARSSFASPAADIPASPYGPSFI